MPASLSARLAAALWIALSVAAPARVFWRHDGGGHGPTAPGRPGWNSAYAARLDINGGKADLDVTGCQLPAPDAMRMLADTYRGMGGSVLDGHGSEIGWGIAKAGDRVIRWLVFSASRPRECIVVRITQSMADFLASGRRPTRTMLDAVPELPGSEPRLFVADLQSRLAMEISTTKMPPAAAMRRMASQLVGDGWTPSVPVDPDSTPSVIYRRGRDLCIVSASPGPEGSSITRLHKVLGGKDGI
ncbi:MAG: hypothetical protein KJ579_08090 [Verrucomicrobia bacterium]|nr:hypothetical protein [Verrucomicrobiota bacterium]